MGTHKPPEESFDRISAFKYSGNKQSHLNEIIPIIREISSPGSTILDIFAGTQAVGYALKRDYRIYSNDAQEYSYIVGKALIENNKTKVSEISAKRELMPHFEKNYQELFNYYNDALKVEQMFLDGCIGSSSKYRIFENQFPHTGRAKFSKHPFYSTIIDLVKDVRDNYTQQNATDHNPHCLFSTYFANHYWGLNQAMEIDSLRYAISQIMDENDEYKKAIYLTALLSAMSLTISGSFHTAEHPEINKSNYPKILKDREKSVVDRFYAKINDIYNNLVVTKRKNKCWNLEYSALLNNKSVGDVDLVYIDPPYNSANYSRFYHSFETMVKYDYPQNEYKGRYREDRLMSDFCRGSKVKQEFNRLLKRVSEFCPNVAISYSTSQDGNRTEMMSVDQIKRLCKKYYAKVRSQSWNANHSSHTQNGSKFKRKKEHLIMCEN